MDATEDAGMGRFAAGQVVWVCIGEATKVRIEELDTPRLTADLNAVERNIGRLQDYCDEHGLQFRPHIKTHKLPAIAHMQLQARAVGITCQKLGEAEVMSAAGISDILITFPLIGPEKGERLATLAWENTMSVVGDSEFVARGLSDSLAAEDVSVDFLVECDTGFKRTGVQSPAAACELAKVVDGLPGLRFTGLMTYPTRTESGPWLRAAREEIEAAGLQVERVSGGGTPGFFDMHLVEGVTEHRAGTYVYGDLACVTDGSVPLEDCALRVRATVVSRPTEDRAILDTGSKSLTNDPVAGTDVEGRGLIVEYPDATIYALSEEHGHVDVGPSSDRPEVGEVVTIVPNHACGTTNMHDEVIAHRDGAVVAIWPIAARGKVR